MNTTASSNVFEQFRTFLEFSDFINHGAVITDLDGTALHEMNGEVHIPQTIRTGIAQCNKAGIPIILNTLRFPMSFIRTFGHDWYSITNEPIPTVLLNGSLLGRIVRTSKGNLEYEEVKAFTLSHEEIDDLIDRIQLHVEENFGDVTLFYYSKHWKNGERIWTPRMSKVAELHDRYRSASHVSSMNINDLRCELKDLEVCMILLLTESSNANNLMAYQLAEKNGYITTNGTDKAQGTIRIAGMLGIDLKSSIGSGDTELDNFLDVVGLAVRVGNKDIPYKGMVDTLTVGTPLAYGEMLSRLNLFLTMSKVKM